MIKPITIVLVILLGSCGSSLGPPRNISDACAIQASRPSWIAAARDVQSKYGVPPHVLLAIVWRESKFVHDARTPRKYVFGIIPRGRMSSAYGFAQALDGTWDEYRENGGRRFARRDNFDDAADFIGWYMTRTVSRNGIPLTDAYNQYLAYHEGHAGYNRGSYRSKRFLLRAANEVRDMSARYERQLRLCS